MRAWLSFRPARLPLHRVRSDDLSPQVTGLKHQQPARVCPCNHALRCHPGVTQDVDGLDLCGAALFQSSLCVAEQLEYSGSAHTELHVVERVEADLTGHRNTMRACIPVRRCGCNGTLTWLTGLLGLVVFAVARTLCFSQSQKISVHPGGPVWPIRYFESAENAMQT